VLEDVEDDAPHDADE